MEEGKRVSWVELYLDLVFVLAVAQIAHLIVAEPEMHSVWIALGLFFTLWWTWVGFAVLYNRYGADERRQRVLFLAAMNGAQHNPTLTAFASRLKAAGKAAKVAIVATARKLLTALNAMIRTEQPWTAQAA